MNKKYQNTKVFCSCCNEILNDCRDSMITAEPGRQGDSSNCSAPLHLDGVCIRARQLSFVLMTT